VNVKVLENGHEMMVNGVNASSQGIRSFLFRQALSNHVKYFLLMSREHRIARLLLRLSDDTGSRGPGSVMERAYI
jgi:hypothetical protein